MLRKLIYIVGFILSVVLVFYLGYQFYISEGLYYLQQFSLKQYFLSFVGIALYVCAIFSVAYAWTLLFDDTSNRKMILAAYLKTILWKYLPSNVMHFVGRHIYLQSISHKRILMSNILDVYFVFFSALILIMLLVLMINSPLPILGYLDQWQLFLLISIFILINLFIIFKKKLFNLKKMLLINANYFSFQLLSSASFIFLWSVFIDNDISVSTMIEIVTIYLVGWLAGFVSVGSPAGIGVREGVYLMLLQPMIASQGLLLAFLLLTRIVNILAEVILFFVAFKLKE
jgi:uncharacterized membrane protein YbhN (UPF0104 family)